MKVTMLISLLIYAGSLQAETMGDKNLEFCHIDGHSQEVLCGTHEVPENPEDPEGRKITISFAIVPSVSEAKEPDPLVFFAGGPGQSARQSVGFITRSMRQVNETRDIVLIDQRGMGDSSPLACEFDEEELVSLPQAELVAAQERLLNECLSELDADTKFYTQDYANQDIHEILMSLGYDKVNLFGASWGTRSALLYATRYPEHVRTVLMDGNAPLENKVPMYANADAQVAIEQLFKDCAADPNCAKAFPNLEQDFYKVLSNLATGERKLNITDPVSGKPIDVYMSRAVFVNILRNLLYAPAIARLVPLIIEQAKDDNFNTLLTLSNSMGDGGMSIGASLTILCSEEMARMTDLDIQEETTKGFVRDDMIDLYKQSCKVWPKAPLPEIYSEQMGSAAPTLLLSGDIDPVTPPKWGEVMAQYMTNSKHLIASNTGHNVSPVGCAPKLIAQFINEGGHENIDGSCLKEVKRPTFFIDLNGPAIASGRNDND